VTKTKKADEGVLISRRNLKSDRRDDDRRKEQAPVAVDKRLGERREKVTRRRQIDPTTCERDYSGDEVEFMNALDQYKRANGRMFPTCSEILEVIRGLGYTKGPAGMTTMECTYPESVIAESLATL
jgi:hypothetical protein